MFDILNENNELTQHLKSMNDNNFFNAVVAHSLVKVYSNLQPNVDRFNEETEGVFEFNLFITEKLNSFIADTIGVDIAAETDTLLVKDGYLPPMANHQLMELVLENWKQSRGSTQIAISVLNSPHLLAKGAEFVIADACKDNYRWSNERLNAVKEHESLDNSSYKINKIEEQISKVDKARKRFINMSADYLQVTGQLREFIESGSTSVQEKLIETYTNLEGHTEFSFNGEGKYASYKILFNDEYALISRGELFEDNLDYEIVSLGESKTFTIDNTQYEASLEGIKTLEIDRFDGRYFEIKGNADYFEDYDSPIETPKPKRKSGLKL